MSWATEITDILVQTSGLLEGLPAERWEAPSLCEGWRVRDVAGHLAWRLGTPGAELAGQVARTMRRRRIGPMWAIDTLSTEAASAPTDELVARLRRIARQKLAGEGRVGLTELTEAVVHSYDITGALGIPIEVEPRVSEAVARARLPLVPVATAAVLTERRLVAADAGWEVGVGDTAVEGSAQGVVLYLFGRRPRSRGRAGVAPDAATGVSPES